MSGEESHKDTKEVVIIPEASNSHNSTGYNYEVKTDETPVQSFSLFRIFCKILLAILYFILAIILIIAVILLIIFSPLIVLFLGLSIISLILNPYVWIFVIVVLIVYFAFIRDTVSVDVQIRRTDEQST